MKNAAAMADELVKCGFDLVSGGTDNHLALLDLRNIGVTGKELEKRLDAVNITANKNAVPFDTTSPMITSGIRLGSPAVTTRGFTEEDMRVVARCIWAAATEFEATQEQVLADVATLCAKHPLYN